MRVDLERVSLNKKEPDYRRIAIYSIAVLIIGLLFGGILLLNNDTAAETNEVVETAIVVKQPTCEEIYASALEMLGKKDSLHLQTRGKELLCTLAEDSSYLPAKMEYYVMLLNSMNPDEVQKGFAELEKIALNDSTNNIALFECGLTLSKANSHFLVPIFRQKHLEVSPDFDRANRLLYKSASADTTDYKSVYWILNNLIEKGALLASEKKQMATLYEMFEERIAKHNDETAARYREAIVNDVKTLKAWGILK